MEIVINILVLIVILEHIYFMYFEMFAWESIGKKSFNSIPKEIFKPTKKLAANQGLYNGFLSAGLICSFFIIDANWATNCRLFFLICIAIAGIYGAITLSRKIFIVQALPALLTILLLLIFY